MSVTGSFTTAAPLAANLANVNIAALVTSFSFNDGINTYSSANANSWIISFDASTDGSGVPNGGMFIVLATWITGSNPHTAADRYSQFEIDFSVDGINNLACSTVGITNGIADTCTSSPGSDNNSSTFSGPSGTWGAAGGPGTTTVNLVSSANPSPLGQAVTFTATVNGSSPTGTVQFKDGSGNLGSAVTLSSAVATFGTSALGAGTHPITAVYGGDANNSGSTSPTVNQVVNGSGAASVSTTIPTLSEWALVLLIGLVLAVAATVLRGRYPR